MGHYIDMCIWCRPYGGWGIILKGTYSVGLIGIILISVYSVGPVGNNIFWNYSIIRQNVEFKPLLGIEDVNQHSSTLRYISNRT